MAVPALQRLVEALGRLPGVGRRSAERMAMYLVLKRPDQGVELAEALREVGERVTGCCRCGAPTAVESDPCRLCTAPGRDDGLVCVVEDPTDIVTLERSGGFRGRYHALMGTLSPARRMGPEDLRVEALLDRVRAGGVREVILALNTDVEGDATAAFLAEALRAEDVAVTRIAFGLPAGSGVRYADSTTLERALRGRTAF